MKTALLLIPGVSDQINRFEYLQECIIKTLREDYMPLTPTLYETFVYQVNVGEFIDRMLPYVDAVYLFVDFGIDQAMLDVIDRSVAAKIELRYRRLMPDITKRLYKTPLQVLLNVCIRTGFTVDQLQSKTRKRKIVDARFVYFRLAKELTNETLFKIGLLVGKDHASVLHGIKEAKNQKAVVELYNKHYGKTQSKAPAVEPGNSSRAPDVTKIERPVLSYRTMDP